MKPNLSFLFRLIVALILLQSLYFKFTAHAQAIHIFKTLGVEPWGRNALGVIELLIGLSLLFPKTQIKASFLAVGILLGAVGTHLFTPVGIEVTWNGQSDQGKLFLMAIIALILSLANIVWNARKKKVSAFRLFLQEFLPL